jgi:hypothetical protein
MKIALVVCSMLFLISGRSCMPFACRGEIHKDDICLNSNETHYLVHPCKEGFKCEAEHTSSVDNLPQRAYCIPDEPRKPKTRDDIAPGDECDTSNKDTCFFGSSCVSGVCKLDERKGQLGYRCDQKNRYI